MVYSGIQTFMEKLKQLINCNDIPSINHPEIIRQIPQFQRLYDELHNPLIQTLFIGQHQRLEKVNDLKKRFIDAAEEAQYFVDLFVSGVHIRNNEQIPTSDDFESSLDLDNVWGLFDSVKVELMSIRNDNMNMASSPTPTTETKPSQSASFTRNSKGSKKVMDEIVVGLEDDLKLVRDKLVEDQKKLQVVSIVGMGGIGKTTLATKVFNDDYVKHHFYVRVWITISQTYNKRDVLMQILTSMGVELDFKKDILESDLREKVHKNLMDKRYLIVIDDIWNTKAWDDIKVFFPHYNNGSRILITSRLMEVAKHANPDGLIHRLGYLSKEQSWDLLCRKVFSGNEFPEWSIKLGMQIVENCHGLPLAVLVIAGVLAKEGLSEKFWVEIAKRTSSYIVGDPNGCLETLALSYNHLPLHLRECFLYLGGFPEDHKFDVPKLIWIWIAEGFIQEDGNRSLEDIAEDYLMDLIDRNLVVVDTMKSYGVVKAYKLHDVVRELCLKKATEEQFILQTKSLIFTSPYKSVRMFIKGRTYIHYQYYEHTNSRKLRSFLGFGFFFFMRDDITKHFHSFVLIRVLDLERCELKYIPKGIELLVHLRYLAILTSSNDFPTSIFNLWNLPTLVCTTYFNWLDLRRSVLPSNISDLVNLRHLHCGSIRKPFFLPSIEKPMNLQTISRVGLTDGLDKFQKNFPYIKKLQCEIYGDEEYDFKSLTCLEELKVKWMEGRINQITFPATLKTLKLTDMNLRGSDMSVIQSLPNLQVLILNYALKGSCWNIYEHEFPQLKFLKLEKLDITQWEVYSTNIPFLRILEIKYCHDLEEIPLEIGNIATLELIKINRCGRSLGNSVKRIQEEQNALGNYDLKIDIID